jgi:type IV pilus assembly protein PilB
MDGDNVKSATVDATLLRFLVRHKLVTAEVAQAAEATLGAQHSEPALIDWLVRRGTVSEQRVAESLAEGLRLPFVDLAAVALDPTVIGLVREELATQHQIVPLRVDDKFLVIATANPLDRAALRTVEFATGKRVRPVVATGTAIRDALQHAYHLDEALGEYLKGIPEDGELPVAEMAEQATTDIQGLMRDTNLAPVVQLFNSVLVEALRTHASDIHIEPTPSGVRVRYRVDGLLEESLRLPKWVQDPLIARCKVLAKLDITERRVPQDGRFRISHREAPVELRVSSLPTQFGEKVTLRVLDPRTAPSGLETFNLSALDLKRIRHAIARPEGMVLVTGPTGSGKTTTLYGMLAEIISPTRNIVTIENPIEYQIVDVNQVEINEKQGLTFSGTLRSILRQDPDVILVGEIRDAETAEIAVRASQTGHLVLSTLHTNDAVATITRLSDLGIAPYMLASSLHLVIAQRLVRRVCPQCAEPYEPEPEALRALQISASGNLFRRGRGCNACRKSGFAGRMGVFEVLSITPEMAKLIEAKAPESALWAQAQADGSRSLAEDAAERVCAGVLLPEEVLRVVDIAAPVRCSGCDQPVEHTFSVCPHCATVLRRNCSACGMRLQKEWLTCPYCGVASPNPVPSPVPPGKETAIASVSSLPAQPSAQPRLYRVLIVDDDNDMRRLMAMILERSALPLSTVMAADGLEALEQAHAAPPDLILLDVMMPGVDGFEVCRQLRANLRTAFVPILMVTARDDAASCVQGFLVGTDDYITKPFNRAELAARVRRLLERTYGVVLPQLNAKALDPRGALAWSANASSSRRARPVHTHESPQLADG